jgi:hypothetical protein
MTKDELDAIRARVAAATPGPWEAGTAFCCPDCGWVDGPKRTVCPVYEGAKRTHTLDANDAEFIASAREDVPALLAEVERLREAAVWEEDQVHRMVTNAHLRGAQETRERMQAEVERLTAERDASHRTGMDRMQQAIIDLLQVHNAPAEFIARIVEMEYP